MKRELSVDARQVFIGDNSTLTLELIREDKKKKLITELRGNGDTIPDYSFIQLAFDNLTSDKEEDKEKFTFEFDISNDAATGREELTFVNIDPDPSPSRIFRRIILLDKVISLKNKESITITFEIEVWDNEGTYTIDGGIYRRNPDNSEDDEELGSTLDFGPVKLKVAEEVSQRPVNVSLNEAKREETPDQLLWVMIRNRTVDFNRYRAFIDRVMCSQDDPAVATARAQATSRYLPFTRAASYSLLRYATEFYLMQEAGVVPLPGQKLIPGASEDGQGGNLNKESRGDRRRLRTKNDLRRTARSRIDLNNLREEYLDQLENEDGRVLPYFKLIRQKLSEVNLKDVTEINGMEYDACYGILKSKLQSPPLVELIWSYYQEEGGLVQTLNAIGLRFQNVRRPGPGPDPLANFNLDPLRPLSNLLWGYIEDERNRLTINRRNLEYQYEYGISLIGRAVQGIPVAEHRTQFLRAFHDLLRLCIEFYQQANFTTVIPDGFPILNHLREVHLALAEGAHNQYGDLPWTARAEMLTQQWILARPEVREFLGGRIMVPYSEPWMDRVDAMKQLQGWNVTNITHFRDLAVFGEQLLLSIRYGSWNDPNVGGLNAANWAHYWREDIQRYVHAYKAVTGVDLANEVTDTRISLPANEDRYLQPAALIERQVALQQNGISRANLPPNRSAVRGQLGQPVQVVRRETFNNE